jgi:hypothetical protein
MLKGKRNSSDAFSEKLIPTRVTITRQRGDLTYVFEIDGFKGEKTGEISYKVSEISRIENFLKSNDPFYSFNSRTIGLIVNYETPMVVAAESIPTGTLAGLEEIFKLQSQAQTRLPQPVLTR